MTGATSSRSGDWQYSVFGVDNLTMCSIVEVQFASTNSKVFFRSTRLNEKPSCFRSSASCDHCSGVMSGLMTKLEGRVLPLCRMCKTSVAVIVGSEHVLIRPQ